jgi:hypothetical protein
MSVPHERSFTLRSDSYSFQLTLLVTSCVELVEAGRDTFVDFNGVGRRVVFVPSRFRVN